MRDWLDRAKEEGTLERREGSGRKSKFTKMEKKKLINLIEGKGEFTLVELANTLSTRDKTIGKDCVRMKLIELEYTNTLPPEEIELK